MKYLAIIIALPVIFAGCLSGGITYTPPKSVQSEGNPAKVIEKPKSEVWKTLVSALGQKFFVINNMDKESGFINVSLSADPEKYLDCGGIISRVKNARGEREYSFPGATASKSYETVESGNYFKVDRNLSFEGRANIIVQEVEKASTKVSVNVKYVLTLNTNQHFLDPNTIQWRMIPDTQTLSFNTGGTRRFPSGVTCIPLGTLERELLEVER